MKKVFYSIAALLAAAWILTFFIFHAGAPGHILLFLAVICWLHAIITMPPKKYMTGEMKQGRFNEEEEGQQQRA